MFAAIKENMEWVHSFVYGANKGVDCRQLWRQL